MSDQLYKKFKEIAEKFAIYFTEDETVEAVKAVENLAALISHFEERKNKPPPRDQN